MRTQHASLLSLLLAGSLFTGSVLASAAGVIGTAVDPGMGMASHARMVADTNSHTGSTLRERAHTDTTPPARSVHTPLRNMLADNPSPYLRMHAHDPVHWQHWGPAAFAIARRENKLLYVSSGYFSCRWCHVMQRENYLNPAIAALINRYFVPVIIDREVNPALDARLIDFVERTRGQAGWPLNVFITPAGYPLVGVTYLPPDHFKPLLIRLGTRWASEAPELKKLARDATAELDQQTLAANADTDADTRLHSPQAVAQRVHALQQAFLKQAFGLADEFQGGFGDQNKFPSIPQLDVLLDLYQQHPHNKKLASFLRLTLDHMAHGGLNDQLSGGFFRYTIDPGWQTPHFEKMLYDNALFARLYLRAGKAFDAPFYTRVGDQTLDFILSTFGNGSRGMAGSLSAVDNKGEDGGYYLWHRHTLQRLLDKDTYRVAALSWGLDQPPTLEGGYHLNQVHSAAQVARQLGWSVQRVQRLLARARTRLLTARAQRHAPIDDKRIAAWNGLTLTALVSGARDGATPAARARYRAAAQRLRDFIVQRMWNGQTLKRALDPAHPSRGFGDAALEDYAYVSAGLYDWAVFSGQGRDLKLAHTILRQAWRNYHSPRGWRLDTSTLLRYGQGKAVMADGPMPSPASVLCRTSLLLGQRLDDHTLSHQAREALLSGLRQVAAEPFWHATRIEALYTLSETAGRIRTKTDTARPR